MTQPGIHLEYSKKELVQAMNKILAVKNVVINDGNELKELLTYFTTFLELDALMISYCKVLNDHVNFEFFCDVDEDIKRYNEQLHLFQRYIDEANSENPKANS